MMLIKSCDRPLNTIDGHCAFKCRDEHLGTAWHRFKALQHLALWEMIKNRLDGIETTEISLRNGTISDCAGCSYTTCLHFGEKGGCFYGGIVVEDVFPAVKQCDALMLLCPNYNDAVSAGLTAFINRLTNLFRQQRFYDKRLYGVIVSGYSGSEILAQQLISSLCMNKSFFLPAHFCILETANDAKSILHVDGVC
jgi:multimeric flavodoxin WrbA